MRKIMTVLAAVGLAGSGLGLEIVENGEPKAVIVVAEDAPQSVAYAAAELQRYVEKMTGAELAVAAQPPAAAPGLIFVGESAGAAERGLSTDGLKPDGFRIVARDNWLALLGRDHRGKPISGLTHPLRKTESWHAQTGLNRLGETGTLYAVYALLERFGVRWYMPGELGEVVPARDTLGVTSMDVAAAPDFDYRFLYNCEFRQDEDAARWHRRAGFLFRNSPPEHQSSRAGSGFRRARRKPGSTRRRTGSRSVR